MNSEKNSSHDRRRKKTTIIFIDHATNFSIVNQTIMNSDNIDKLNFRFVKVFIYLSQFNLNVKYKIDKFNVVSNEFSRLLFTNDSKDSIKMNALNLSTYHNDIENILNTIHVFQNTLIFMTIEFRRKLIEEYSENKS